MGVMAKFKFVEKENVEKTPAVKQRKLRSRKVETTTPYRLASRMDPNIGMLSEVVYDDGLLVMSVIVVN